MASIKMCLAPPRSLLLPLYQHPFRTLTGIMLAIGIGVSSGVCADPTNGPLTALGLTNVPIGESTLELVEGNILFVHNSDNGGVSVLLGEADSGVFLYPLTGYVYGGDTMEARAYGRVGGETNRFISSIQGTHNGDQSATVTVDFSPLGATRLSVFVGSMLLGHVTNSSVPVYIQGNGYGCRANPWWRLPDGSYGAIVELASMASVISIPLNPDQTAEWDGGSDVFIRPDDPTNSVGFISRVDVTSSGLGSFCMTEARLGVFHQAHRALGQATLYPSGGRLEIGNLVSNGEDGLFVELPGVSAFQANFVPIDLPTNSLLLISGFGTAGLDPFLALGTARVGNPDGKMQIGVEMGVAPQTTEVQVLSNGVVMGSATVLSALAQVDLSGTPRLSGVSILAKTMETLPGFSLRVDRPTTFTLASNQTFNGDEVRMLATEPVVFETLESFVMVSWDLPSFTITQESTFVAPAPTLSIQRATNGMVLAWPDPNRIYDVEVTSDLAENFGELSVEKVYNNNFGQVTVGTDGTDGSNRFFRLRRRMPNAD